MSPTPDGNSYQQYLKRAKMKTREALAMLEYAIIIGIISTIAFVFFGTDMGFHPLSFLDMKRDLNDVKVRPL